MDYARRSQRLLASLLVACVVLCTTRVALADKVDVLINRMLKSSDYKQRLSAALNLQKTGDPRAIPAYIKALDDDDKTVRGVAAAALGKLIDSSTPAKVRSDAMAALKVVAAKDANAFVRKQAQKSYNAIKNLGSGAPTGAKIYVSVGVMSDGTKKGKKAVQMMRRTVDKTFRKQRGSWAYDEAGGKPMSKGAIKKSKLKAYYVDGTLTELTATPRGAAVIVECKVSMLIATFPEKSMFGFLKGGAKVQASNNDRDIGFAQEDCVNAVAEDLVKRKIIPTIETRSN